MITAADLAETVRAALAQSATMIVICSPNVVRSRWVNEEIRTYRALGRARFIHCLIVAGEPHASRKPGLDPALECFPDALYEDGPFDPVAADVRPNTDGKAAAKLRLIAGMIGVGYTDLRQREAIRQQRRLMAITAASLAGIVVTSGLAVAALVERNNAIAQRDLARRKTMTAEHTVDFVKSIFVVSDPSEALGRTITVREVLDRSARRLSQSLDDEPNVKAELITTLGDVYGSLGLFKESDAQIARAVAIPGLDADTRTKLAMARGEAKLRLADYAAAAGAFGDALRLAEGSEGELLDLRPRILAGLSDAQSSLGDFRAAEAAAGHALRLSRSRFGDADPMTAQVHEVIGLDAAARGDLARARRAFEEALAIRLKAQDRLHPKITEDLNQLGSIRYLLGDSAAAEAYYRQVLQRDVIVYGANHPETALTQNNLGRILLERRKFAQARPLLERAVATTEAQRTGEPGMLAFLYANLALVEHGLGRLPQAEAMFRKALVPARLHRHRTLAPILADLADTLCDERRFAEALPLLDEAAPIMAATYPDDPWRTAWVRQVRGKCLLASGDRATGTRLVRDSARPVGDRWPADSLFGAAVAANLRTAAGART
jgi:tetratricopeptide (TPR) repeat protein